MKTTKEMIEVMQAYERGEQIEFVDTFDNESEWKIVRQPTWNWYKNDYRVKPKKKYVPFETAEEFLAAQKEHGTKVHQEECPEFFAHVDCECNVLLYEDIFKGCKRGTFNELIFYGWMFADGTTCGKEVEE